MIFYPFRDFIIQINHINIFAVIIRCSLAKISMVAELVLTSNSNKWSCSLAKISMEVEQDNHETK